jgi:hypothetical protein
VHPYLLAVAAYEAQPVALRKAFLVGLSEQFDRSFAEMIRYAASERAIQRTSAKYHHRFQAS